MQFNGRRVSISIYALARLQFSKLKIIRTTRLHGTRYPNLQARHQFEPPITTSLPHFYSHNYKGLRNRQNSKNFKIRSQSKASFFQESSGRYALSVPRSFRLFLNMGGHGQIHELSMKIRTRKSSSPLPKMLFLPCRVHSTLFGEGYHESQS